MSSTDGAAPPAKKEESAPAPAPASENRGPRRGPRGEKTCYNCGQVRSVVVPSLLLALMGICCSSNKVFSHSPRCSFCFRTSPHLIFAF